MASYRIVCVEKDEHIISVGTGDNPQQAVKRWKVADVRAAIKDGNRFYTVSPSTGKEANVELFEETIRTGADGIADNNLDNLRACRWN